MSIRKVHNPITGIFAKKTGTFFEVTDLEKYLKLGGDFWQFFGPGYKTFKNEVFLVKLATLGPPKCTLWFQLAGSGKSSRSIIEAISLYFATDMGT